MSKEINSSKYIKNLTKYALKLIIGDVNIIASIANYFDVSERSKMYLLESVQDIKTFGVNYVLNNVFRILTRSTDFRYLSFYILNYR